MNRQEDFFSQVYDLVRQIPCGRVCTYGLLGASLGAPRSARLVGHAMSLSHHIQPAVPAHRVVNSQGLLTGKFHFETMDLMQELLEREGILIKNDKVQNFKTLLWNPMLEL